MRRPPPRILGRRATSATSVVLQPDGKIVIESTKGIEIKSQQDIKVEAETQWNVVADALREKQPKLGALMDASRDDVLAYIAFPREHWAQTASTNPSNG